MQYSVISSWITCLNGSQPSSVVLSTHNCVISTRIKSLYWFLPLPVVLYMQIIEICTWITRLYGSQHSSVVFACKTARFALELQVSVGPRPHLSFCACKTACLASELLVSMGPSPHLWFLDAKQWLWTRITSLYGYQTSPVILCLQNHVISTKITTPCGS